MNTLTREGRFELASDTIWSIEFEGNKFEDDELEVIRRWVDGKIPNDKLKDELLALM